VGQDILAADLVIQGVEAIAGFCLRFRVQRLLLPASAADFDRKSATSRDLARFGS
jgi:hypothetical protein